RRPGGARRLRSDLPLRGCRFPPPPSPPLLPCPLRHRRRPPMRAALPPPHRCRLRHPGIHDRPRLALLARRGGGGRAVRLRALARLAGGPVPARRRLLQRERVHLRDPLRGGPPPAACCNRPPREGTG